jgi:aminobenzoyl-glutamate transport protein
LSVPGTVPSLQPAAAGQESAASRVLAWIERVGNRLPDPAMHFLLALGVTLAVSALLAGRDFGILDPRTGAPLQVLNQLSPEGFTGFVTGIVRAFVSFPPLGIVLVMVLGVGVAEHSGLVGAALESLMKVTPVSLLTPIVAVATILGHAMGDAGLLLLAPLAGAMFYACGRHPLCGIITVFAVDGGAFVANFVPTAFEPLVAGLTQSAAQIIEPGRTVNPLSNFWYSVAAGVVTVPVTWWVADRIIEPRLRATPVDGDPALLPRVEPLTPQVRRGLLAAAAVAALLAVAVAASVLPASSPLRAADGSLSGRGAPLMEAIIPIMFVLTAVPGTVYGYVAGTFSSHRDVIASMSKAMAAMSYYLVMVFFAALFIMAFSASNLGALLALKGGLWLKAMDLPVLVTLGGIMVLTTSLNLLVASASAKWAMLAPIFVPMLMTAGIAPEVTQAAFRIGDAPTNITSPLNPYFPLIVAFCARYVTSTGIGTVISLSVPYALAYGVVLTGLLVVFWALGLPLGVQAAYAYP